jgi:hypothetical protein
VPKVESVDFARELATALYAIPIAPDNFDEVDA